MLATHLPQIDLLLRNGVTVHGARRPLRLILCSDYAAQCSLLGQKSATDTQPCLYCKTLSGRAASRRCLTPPLAPFKTSRAGGTCESARTLSSAWRLMTCLGQAASPANPIIISRSAETTTWDLPAPKIPISLHTTQGVDHRLMGLAVEIFMVRRISTDGVAAGSQAGAAFSLELVAVLHEKVCARPTSHHGGLFIGRDCHTIGDNSALVCAALIGKASEAHLAAHTEAWQLRNCGGPGAPRLEGARPLS